MKIIRFKNKQESEVFFDWILVNGFSRKASWNNDESACMVESDILDKYEQENGSIDKRFIDDEEQIYRIIKRKDGGTEKTYSERLYIEDAQKEILELFNRAFDENALTWEEAVKLTAEFPDGAVSKFPDGTRSFSCDTIHFSIEKENFV